MFANELVASIERDVASADARIEAARSEIRGYLDRAKAEHRAELSANESARTSALFKDIEHYSAARKRNDARLTRAREVAAEETEYERTAWDKSAWHTTPAANRAPAANRNERLSVTRNERTYHEGNDPSGRQFLLDVARGSIFSDVQSNERLSRHMAEERIERPMSERVAGDATTASFGVGLVVPQYLVDMYAPAVANMRPLANVANHHTLPPQGMTLNLSRITTASSAAIQASQLATVSTTSLAETDLSIAVQTAAGSQNVSRQAIERGTGIEDVTAQDLFKRVATVLDATMITQASTGIQASAQNVTYTSASPTGAEMWPYIFQAESKLEQALLSQARVDYVVMHSRRWNWLSSQVGTSWPFMGAQNSGVAPQQGALQVTNEYGAAVRGVLSNGLKVVVDANVPTNTGGSQDEIYVMASDEVHLWEDPSQPMLIRAEQANAAALGVLLVAYSYFAYTVGRFANNPSKITGTGLAAPAGF
jgi:hypothetical protein